MLKPYNQYNLEALFEQFLQAENVSAVTLKNYLSDYRHFDGWLKLYALSRNLEGSSLSQLIHEQITTVSLEEYRRYLSENNLPVKTINRRLSTIRKFCSFCISQGWLSDNPAKMLENIKEKNKLSLLNEYQSYILHIEQDDEEAQLQLKNIEEFYQIINL